MRKHCACPFSNPISACSESGYYSRVLIRASFLQPSRAINGCPCVPRHLFPFQLLYLLMFSVECLPLSPTAGGLCPSPPETPSSIAACGWLRRGAGGLTLSKCCRCGFSVTDGENLTFPHFLKPRRLPPGVFSYCSWSLCPMLPALRLSGAGVPLSWE